MHDVTFDRARYWGAIRLLLASKWGWGGGGGVGGVGVELGGWGGGVGGGHSPPWTAVTEYVFLQNGAQKRME